MERMAVRLSFLLFIFQGRRKQKSNFMRSLLYAASMAVLATCLAGCKPEEPQEPQEPQEPEKPVLESLSFEQTELELNVGDVHLLEVIASPSDAEGYTLQWESSDEAVASVSDDGEVTALSAGTADITVSSGEISATCAVTVKEPVIPVESVSLDVQQIELGIGETYALQATVLPENATDKTVTWTSSAPEIVSVDENGTVESLAAGNATVTVTTVDGGMTAECEVTVAPIINGHEYVDLGLSVKWATCNIGAENPWDYGDYFAWGETEPKDDYSSDNCLTYGIELPDISGDPEYDAARAGWGGTWRMPTGTEMDELISECTWEWTTEQEVAGYKVTGPNGNSIFLPAAGSYSGTTLFSAGSYGYYRGSTPSGSDPEYVYAYSLYFYSSNHAWTWDDRYYGESIRAVSE